MSAFFVCIVILYYRMVYNEKKSNIIKDGRMAAVQSADQFDKYLSTNVDMIKFAAYTLDEMIAGNSTDKEIQDYLVNQSTAVKNAVLENSTGLYGYINGRFFSGTNWVPPADYDATNRPWYTKPFENPGKLTMLEPYVDIQTGNTMLALGKTLSDGQSVISVDISLDQVQKLTEEAVLKEDSDIEMILTGTGVVVTHSDINEVGKNYSNEDETLGNKIYNLVKNSDENFFEFKYKGCHYIVYSAAFQDNWHCISVHDATSVFASLTKILILTIAVIIITILIIGVMIARSTSRDLIAEHAIAANEAKNAFLSKMSHEIRTPINAMLGMNEMILRESDNKDIISYAEEINTSGNALLGMVDEIIDYTKQEAEDDRDFSFLRHRKERGAAEREAFTKNTFIAPDARILVCDDNPINLTVFSSLLKRTKMKIDTAVSADEAIELTQKNVYDIIFLDHMMPKKDGIEALHEIVNDASNPNCKDPIVVITANAVPGAKKEYLAAGFWDYLTKPIDPEKLEETILKYLPDYMVQRVDAPQEEALPQGLPDEVLNLPAQSLINFEEGLKNSATYEGYKPLLKIFHTSIEDNSKEIEDYYNSKDWKNYAIRVHALKSSARIIGASDYGEEAQALENAAKREDVEYIKSHHEGFMKTYKSFKDVLAPLFPAEAENVNKPVADEELISGAYAELREAAENMDCDTLLAIFDELGNYRMPEGDAELWKKVREAAENYDYDKVIALADSRK